MEVQSCYNLSSLDLKKELARCIGKLSSSQDFNIYDYKDEKRIIIVYEPLKYPEKIQPLLYCLNLGDLLLLNFQQKSKEFAELCLAAELSEKKGYVVSQFYEEYKEITKGLKINNYELLSENLNEIKEKLLIELEKNKMYYSNEDVNIIVDNYFIVKSIGLVAIGKLESGRLKVHDKLKILPQNKEVEIKSIQVFDKDVKETENSRVGIVLKGIDYSEMDKGNILTTNENDYVVSKDVKLRVDASKFSKSGVQENKIYYLNYGLQFVKAIALEDVKPSESKIIRFKTEKEFVINKKKKVLIANPNEFPRIIGTAEYYNE
ncbi:MAG: EF-Tu/IF-2/RF-3 family GTPase [Candidatus Anstonellales archaeon]